MAEVKTRFPQMYPDGTLNGKDDYSDPNIVEVDLPVLTEDQNVIPDEVPGRSGPGGE